MESLPVLAAWPYGWFFRFAQPLFTLPDGPIYPDPTVSMTIHVNNGRATIDLASRLTPLNAIDGPSVIFKPITASVVPEPGAATMWPFVATTIAGQMRRRK
jgi:hypothetical protein